MLSFGCKLKNIIICTLPVVRSPKLNIVQKAQVCDATGDAMKYKCPAQKISTA